jgi:hypothetical protein
MPLLLLLATILFVNLLTPEATRVETAVSSLSTPAATQPGTTPSTATRAPILPAIILPSPTPTIAPSPQLPATAAITVYGPPPNSNLPQNGRIAFYWTYSESVQPGQQFALSLRQDGEVFTLGTVVEPNAGDTFQLLIDFSSINVLPGTAVWQLHLEWQNEAFPLVSSQERIINFISD